MRETSQTENSPTLAETIETIQVANTTVTSNLSNSTSLSELSSIYVETTFLSDIPETIISRSTNVIPANFTVTYHEIPNSTEYLIDSTIIKINDSISFSSTSVIQDFSNSTAILNTSSTTTKTMLESEEINRICFNSKILNDSYDISKGCLNKCRDPTYNETHFGWIGFLSNFTFSNIYPKEESCLVNVLWEKDGNY